MVFLLILYNLFILLLLIFIGILIGMIGFRYIVNLSTIDSFYNAALYMTGAGDGSMVITSADKIFVSFYSILSGIIFLSFILYFVGNIISLEGF